jgi:nitroreductase
MLHRLWDLPTVGDYAMSHAVDGDHPIHEILANRWSPYGFSDRAVSDEDICSLFEAARWAASSYNEQPWSYVVATQRDKAMFERLLSCLVEGNQGWAGKAHVLALAIASLNFSRNGAPNGCAHHDLGLAAGNLCAEATARGVAVHQMAGILPDRARELYQIPDGHEAVTALAIGYAGNPSNAPDEIKQRDSAPRQRRKLSEFVFGGLWGSPLDVVS